MKTLNLFVLSLLLFQACNNAQLEKEKVSEPEIDENQAVLFLPGKVNTGLFEMNASFSKSGDEFYYSIADPFQNFNAILSVKKENNNWGNPEVVSFSGQYSDFDPFITYDGEEMFFCSRRSLPNGNNERNYANIQVSRVCVLNHVCH